MKSRTWLQATSQIEKRYIPSFFNIAMSMRKQAIKNLKAGGKDYAISRIHSVTDKVSPLLTKIYRTAGLMGAKMTYDDLKATSLQKANGFGRNDVWINAVLTYLRTNGLEMATNISDTMKEDIIAILQKAVDEGLSIDQMVRELERTPLAKARAAVIARTETIRAANVGHAIGAQSSPYEVTKKWNAARDERTRPSHQHVNGIMIDEMEGFKVEIYRGGRPTGAFDIMQFPGDKNATAGNVVNCRCRVTYVPKRDANGRLIMRNPNSAIIIPMNTPTRYEMPGIAASLKANITIGVEK